MPDQYIMAQFQRNELQPGHPPVMAEIELVSSHTPWLTLPRMLPWNEVGDGSIYDDQPAQSRSASAAWRSASTFRAMCGQSIQYSLTALVSWVAAIERPESGARPARRSPAVDDRQGPGSDHLPVMSIVARSAGARRRALLELVAGPPVAEDGDHLADGRVPQSIPDTFDAGA